MSIMERGGVVARILCWLLLDGILLLQSCDANGLVVSCLLGSTEMDDVGSSVLAVTVVETD